MPWNVIAAGAIGLAVAGWLFRRRGRHSSSSLGATPDVGVPPSEAEPIVEPRLQDIGSGSYELLMPGQPPEEPRADAG